MKYATIATVAILSACAPMVEVTDLAEVDEATRARAAQIDTYVIGQQPPPNVRVVAPIEAFSCKHLLTDPPASTGDALQQLQLKALNLGATAIINVAFDTRGTDAWGTNCWETVQATGIAVR